VKSEEWRVERGRVAGALVQGRPWERGRGETREKRGARRGNIFYLY